jgi:DNA primase
VIGLAQGAGTGPNTELTVVGIAALLLAALFVQRGWDTKVVTLLLVAGVATVVGAFTVFADRDDAGGAVAEEVSGARLRAAVVSLCEARAEEDPREVERLFIDRAHAQMHLLAQALDDDHRRRAAELLETMQRVEADLSGNSAAVSSSLSELIQAAAKGLTALSIDPPTCAQ